MKEIYVRDAAELSKLLHVAYYDMELCAEWVYETYYDHNYIFLNHGDEEGSIKKILFYEIGGSSVDRIKTIRGKHADEWDNVEFIIGIEGVEDFENWFYSLCKCGRLPFPPLDRLFTESECCFKFLDHKEYRKSGNLDDQISFVEVMVKYLGN